MKKVVMSLTFVLVAIFCFYGAALSDGGGPEDPGSDCTCFDILDPPPRPDSGPFIWGTFTVARDRDTFDVSCDDMGFACDHFNVHVTLRRFGKVHLFHTFRRVPYGIINGDFNICDLTSADLKDAYKRLACDLNVEEFFDLEGTPVIVKLRVTQRECFETTGPLDTPEQMIKGNILLRVVPTLVCDQDS